MKNIQIITGIKEGTEEAKELKVDRKAIDSTIEAIVKTLQYPDSKEMIDNAVISFEFYQQGLLHAGVITKEIKEHNTKEFSKFVRDVRAGLNALEELQDLISKMLN